MCLPQAASDAAADLEEVLSLRADVVNQSGPLSTQAANLAKYYRVLTCVGAALPCLLGVVLIGTALPYCQSTTVCSRTKVVCGACCVCGCSRAWLLSYPACWVLHAAVLVETLLWLLASASLLFAMLAWRILLLCPPSAPAAPPVPNVTLASPLPCRWYRCCSMMESRFPISHASGHAHIEFAWCAAC